MLILSICTLILIIIMVSTKNNQLFGLLGNFAVLGLMSSYFLGLCWGINLACREKSLRVKKKSTITILMRRKSLYNLKSNYIKRKNQQKYQSHYLNNSISLFKWPALKPITCHSLQYQSRIIMYKLLCKKWSLATKVISTIQDSKRNNQKMKKNIWNMLLKLNKKHDFIFLSSFLNYSEI